jgi:hypothetical protein
MRHDPFDDRRNPSDRFALYGARTDQDILDGDENHIEVTAIGDPQRTFVRLGGDGTRYLITGKPAPQQTGT